MLIVVFLFAGSIFFSKVIENSLYMGAGDCFNKEVNGILSTINGVCIAFIDFFSLICVLVVPVALFVSCLCGVVGVKVVPGKKNDQNTDFK